MRPDPRPARSCAASPRGAGFTLVELLVVVAVVGVLVGLLIPAVQSARESARRVACGNRLKQIGLALIAYEATHRELPVGCVEWRCYACGPDFRQLAWNVPLLPHLEEATLHDAIDTDEPFDSETNAAAAATLLDVFVCPSGERGATLEQGRGPSDYGGIFGQRITGPPPCPPDVSPGARRLCPRGVLLHESPIRMQQVTDGASHTIAVGEDVGFPDGQWINGRNLFDQSSPTVNGAPPFENDLRSDHPGGAQAVTLDGAVRFLAEALEPTVLAALCTRAGSDSALAEVANDL